SAGNVNLGAAGSAPGLSEPPDGSIVPPDASAAPSPAVAALRAALAERYSFDGTGQDVIDSLGGAKGWIYNASLDGEGFVRLNGNDAYVSLPNQLLSSGSDRTIEVWLIWRGGAPWQRIFDFGTSDAGELKQGMGTSYLFLTPRADSGMLRVAYSLHGTIAEVRVDGARELPTDTLVQVAVAVDSAKNAMSLYLDGGLQKSVALDQRLTSILDDNAWIGRSQFAADPGLLADILDVRIYNRALDANQIALSFTLGSDSSLDAQE
ncbi:MAG TPA: LamG-like jellyroll fold domain-containing protein, partial [Polyangiaceae bacterium]|nr:LamG-like jellyroll fold domain-containing protein [Polyangiaceae bacterium]